MLLPQDDIVLLTAEVFADPYAAAREEVLRKAAEEQGVVDPALEETRKYACPILRAAVALSLGVESKRWQPEVSHLQTLVFKVVDSDAHPFMRAHSKPS